MADSSRRRPVVLTTLFIAVVWGLSIYLVAVGNSEEFTAAGIIQFNLWMTSFTVVGAFITLRVPGNVIGWLCLAFAATWGVSSLAEGLPGYYEQGPATWVPDVFALVFPFWALGVALIGFLMLYFPDGRLPTPMASLVARILWAVTAFLMITGLIAPEYPDDSAVPWVNPFAVEYPIAVARSALLVVVACLLAAALVVISRFRRSTGVERMQLKWLAAAGSVAAVGFLVFLVVGVTTGFQPIHPQILFALIPVAIGFAVLRHRLYDIDRIISRTVTYGVVVTLLGTVFFGLVVSLRSLIPGEGAIPVAASTLVVAFAFLPLARSVQRMVDRRFNRSRYDAALVLDRLVADLQGSVEIDEIKDRTQSLVAEAFHPSSLGIWVADEG
jgi:hypothetical protein